jgi:hypothetical protein
MRELEAEDIGCRGRSEREMITQTQTKNRSNIKSKTCIKENTEYEF